MADYFDSAPNFTNPAYATPEQLATARAYAAELTKRSGENVNRPTGALANMITALTAGLTRNNADTMQSQAAAGNQRQLQAIIEQLKNGGQQPMAPQSTPQAAPMASAAPSPAAPPAVPPTPEGVTRLDPQATAAWRADTPLPNPAAGAAAASSPPAAGVQAQGPGLPPGQAPAPNFDQRFSGLDPKALAYVLANPMSSPEQRAIVQHLIQPEAGKDTYNQPTYQSPLQGVRTAPVAGPAQYGIPGQVNVGPEGVTAPAVSRPGNTSVPFFQGQGGNGLSGAMDVTNRMRLNANRTGAVADFAKADMGAANDAPMIKTAAGTMLDDLRTHGDKMTFGPTAEWSNNIKRAAANYAPGLMKDQLESLASADSFDKMSAQLTGMLSKGGGTDASLFNNMRSVPGSHNSKEGAEALLKMVIQRADQSQALAQATSKAQTPEEYTALKNQFYAQNPIVNPITGNPIKLDLENGSAAGGGFKVLKVH